MKSFFVSGSGIVVYIFDEEASNRALFFAFEAYRFLVDIKASPQPFEYNYFLYSLIDAIILLYRTGYLKHVFHLR